MGHVWVDASIFAKSRARVRFLVDAGATFTSVSVLALACGGHIDLAGSDEPVQSRPPSMGGAGGGSPSPGPSAPPPIPDCEQPAEATTRLGPCADWGLECGHDGKIDCGTCPGEQSCVDGRCHHTLGRAPDFVPDLMRALRTEGEGTICTVDHTGALERVEAALWDAGTQAITMDVYSACGAAPVARVATLSLPASEFPPYDGIHGEMRSTMFTLDPPVALEAGDVVAVMFHAEGSSQPGLSAVSGIGDASELRCSFGTLDGTLGGITDPSPWDYMARLYLH